MSIAQTFTVTVAGGKFVIDGVSQDTVMIGAGLTYKFDQADSSNSTHPLRFSTTSDGTHSGGSEYTTGVTTSGTPGEAGAYTQIEVAAGAPSTLYYYCANHSGMGGQANTDGWGRSNWDQADWGDTNITETGWGRNTWGYQTWGDTPIVELTAPSELTASLPDTSWGAQDWGSSNASGDVGVTWGGNFILTPADVMGLSGVSSTASVGSIDLVIDFTGTLSGLGATSSVGSVTPNENADMLVGLTGQAGTSSVGAITPADVVGLTGVSATVSLGTITVGAEDLINVTGVGATASVGSVTVAGMAIGLSGLSATASTGSIAPTEMSIGLTGVSATIGGPNIGGPIAWKKVTPTQGGSWSKKTATQGGSLSKVTPP